MNIQDILRQYKKKKSIVETIEIRIRAYEQMLLDFDSEVFEVGQTIELGMPHSPNRSTTSPQERSMMLMEYNREEVKEIIKGDKSRLFWPKLEIEQINKAMEGLTSWGKYIVELKYFDGMPWRNIEISFNDQYPQKNDITEMRLKQINAESIVKLSEILEPFYEQYEKVYKLSENYTKIIQKLSVSRNSKVYTYNMNDIK